MWPVEHSQSTAPRIVHRKTRAKPSVLSPGLVTAERAAIPLNRYSGCITSTTARNETTGSEALARFEAYHGDAR